MGKEDRNYGFKKGSSGNPKGRPKQKARIVELKKVAYDEFIKLITKLLKMTVEEVEDLAERKDKPMLASALASVLVKANTTGDPTRLNFFLERLYGKVADKVQVQGEYTHKPLQQYIQDRGEED